MGECSRERQEYPCAPGLGQILGAGDGMARADGPAQSVGLPRKRPPTQGASRLRRGPPRVQSPPRMAPCPVMSTRLGALSVAGIAGLLACALTRSAAAEPTDSTTLEPGPTLTLDRDPPPSARTYTVIGGLATTAAWYGLALGSSYIWPDTVGEKDMRIPVAGPWIAFSHSGCGPNVADCHEAVVVLRAIVTALDGIGQAGGLAILGQGLFLPTQEPSRQRSSLKWQPVRGVQMQPTFDAGKNTVGLGVLGVF
jgi:hypothetical protein